MLSFKFIGISMSLVLGGLLLMAKPWAKKEKKITSLEAHFIESLHHYLSEPKEDLLETARKHALNYWAAKGKTQDEAMALFEKEISRHS